MKIALISDIHDHNAHLAWFLQEITAHDASLIIGLGDYCSPFIIELLATTLLPIRAIWGNNDGDKLAMFHASKKHADFTFAAREFEEMTIDGHHYFLTHYPLLAEHAAKSGNFDAVFHGHTHRMRNEEVNGTVVINPGKLSSYPHSDISFAIFDTSTNTGEFIIKK